MKFYSLRKLLLISFMLFAFISQAQQPWMVYFDTKPVGNFDPAEYFDSKAIQRRADAGISLNDFTDWPVNQEYITKLSDIGVQILHVSRWFNAAGISANYDQINLIKSLPFVTRLEQLSSEPMLPAYWHDYDTTLKFNEAEVLTGQLQTLGVKLWDSAGYDGHGIRIAIFDVGFDYADKVPAFDHIRNSGRLIASHDFTNRRNGDFVYYGNGHGTQVWSCIGGKTNSYRTGLATGAEFLLAKTEKASEKYAEELNWLAAAEWADKQGADIINSSLGYTEKRYFYWQMDGKTSFVSRAANMAARKGMLVVNAAGNEGSGNWHYIGAPADADSVLAVGGIDPFTGYHTSFSSFGPTTDKRMKPNVCAYGHVIAAAPGRLVFTQGTSFASPLVAGFAACAWQSDRKLSNMQLFREIEKSGSLYPYFDYAHGFGVPEAEYFLKLKKPVSPTFRIIESNDSLIVEVNQEFESDTALYYDFEEDYMGNQSSDSEDDTIQTTTVPAINGLNKPVTIPYLYYNLTNSKGVIDEYYVLDVNEKQVFYILRSNYPEGEILNVSYKGYTSSIKI